MKGKLLTTGFALGKTIQKEKSLEIIDENLAGQKAEFGVINVYPDIEAQTIEGFGGAMTESSAWLLSQMTVEDRKKALSDFFGKDGNNYKYIRVHLDSCDFSLSEYQAVEDPSLDPELKTFSLERDHKYIIPMLKEAMEISEQELSVLLSPWSPPSCWKTPAEKPSNDAAVYGGMPEEILSCFNYEKPTRTAGKLKKEHYHDWAVYMVKYVKSYIQEGIPVTMLTIQNESSAATYWDSCVWTAEEQKEFLKDHLYPEMEAAGLVDEVGIYIWDHNKERAVEFVKGVLDQETLEMVEGIAIHWYSGDHFDALRILGNLYPNKTIMSSECCGMLPFEGAGMGFEMTTVSKSLDTMIYDTAAAYAHDIIGNLNNGMNRWIDWNLCLDEKGGPRHVPGACTASMTVHPDHKADKTAIFDYVGHFSRYILPGAKRIECSICDSNIEVTAAKNQDGSYAVVLLIRGNDDRRYVLRMDGMLIKLELPGNSISTVVLR